MSFQDFQNGKRPSASSSTSRSPSQAVAAGIFQINTAVAGFRRLVDAIGTDKDTPEHRLKLHNSRQRILQLVKETSAKLKSLSELDHDPDINPSKKIEDAKLARDFQITLQEFQKVQQLSSERESTYSPSLPPQSSLPPSCNLLTSLGFFLGHSSSPGEYLVAIMDQDSQPLLREQRRQEVILLDNEVAFNEAIIEEREQGIRDIEEQIGEANEIFKDLAVLVHDQGVVIDDIHSNIDSSAATTMQARVQLSKASKSVKTKCSWVMLVATGNCCSCTRCPSPHPHFIVCEHTSAILVCLYSTKFCMG
ncbi:hypothetical protein DKX38_021407 [Salix brachista]|uniref:t-SNARE coiled-coil homology domain-containing protein n=1 Tax=Salix brachista TaxID=2182728 RepID=A0A5N5KBP5_9ROSI|nr:hypothetical protein DKX38_021407 [Salix brachista]